MWLKKWKLNNQLGIQSNRKKVGKVLIFLGIGIFFLFTLRFSYIIAVGKVGNVSLKEKMQELYHVTKTVPGKRGTIYDRNGLVLAEDSVSFTIYAVLDQTYMDKNGQELFVHEKNHHQIAEILHKYAGIEKELVLSQLKPQKNEQGNPVTTVEFGAKGQNLDFAQKNTIDAELKKQQISGIYFREETKRSYLNGDFASYFIGFVGQDDQQNNTGMLGLEASYNQQLSGKNGWITYKKEWSDDNISSLNITKEKKAQNGESIYTTLDASLQTYLDKLLTEVNEAYSPGMMTASLMEAKTGNILAASQRPSFDVDTLQGVDQNNFTWMNLLTDDTYEPGSTMKPLLMAAAIQEQKFSEEETFQSGKIEIDGAVINDWNAGQGKGEMTFRQGLAWSSNVGVVTLHQRMPTQWQEYLQKFGFSKPTDIGLVSEASGKIQNTTTVDRAMSSYGQAISVTHVQMLQAYTAIANNGVMLQPNLVKKIVDKNGKEQQIKPKVKGTPISSETAQQVLDYMQDVILDPVFGLGKEYAIQGVNVAAKTGTAEISEGGIYSTSEYLHSVVQIVPKENPKYIFYMTMKKPITTTISANEIIASVSNKLLKRALALENN